MTTPAKGEPTALYRLYDADEQLIYVGITNNPANRWRRHQEVSLWWPKVATKTIEWLPDRESALTAERSLIEEHNPPYNSHWNTSEIKSRIYGEKHRAKWDRIKADLAANPPEWMKTGQFLPDE
jgi:predicted GIY-YIG superfamily endonuclease